INSFSIGVNDTTTYVTRADFDTKISTIELQLASIDQRIATSIVNYLTQNAPWFDGSSSIEITKNQTSNRYTLSAMTTIFSGVGSGIPATWVTLEVVGWQWPNTNRTRLLTANKDCTLSLFISYLTTNNQGLFALNLYCNDRLVIRTNWGNQLGVNNSVPTTAIAFYDCPMAPGDYIAFDANGSGSCAFDPNSMHVTIKGL
ncbi:MAG: hypothetical protein Q4F88_06895, partial [Eubacteriales bacterium]|nr:hypothetical protein [Eubacteriales bacterium]